MDNKIKVLHMFRELEIGGIQSFLGNIYEEMDKTKITFDFLVSSKGILDEKYLGMDSKIYYIPYITEVGPIKYKRELKRFFDSHKEYKIVHIHFDQMSGLVAEVAKSCGIENIICHAHVISNNTNIIGKAYKNFLRRKISKNATHLYACSIDAAKWIFKKDYKKAKIIFNGIDVEKFKFNLNKRNEIRSLYDISNNTNVIGCVGRLSVEKNHSFLLRVFAEYLKINPTSVLLIVGDGTEKRKLQELSEKLNIDKKVIFTGMISNVNEIYSAIDFFVFPSLNEGFGIALIEAQISGLQCIASKNIPFETQITSKIDYLDLKSGEKAWAEKISEKNLLSIHERAIYCNSIESSNYNIKKVSNLMFEEYTKMWRNKG